MSLRGFLKRFGIAMITLTVAMLLTFILLRKTPGSAIDAMARNLATQQGLTLDVAYERVAAMINYNPNEPILSQLVRYIKGMLHGNLGTSMIYQNTTVNKIVANAMPWTLFVLTFALSISFVIGVNLGTIMAWKRKTILNPIISVYSIISMAIPNFLIAILLLIVFSFQLNWFPFNGAYDVSVTPGFSIEFILDVLHHAALPILTYVITTLGGWTLGMKGNCVSILGEDYVNAAWIRGVPDKNIMKNYVKRNAMLPMITGLAVSFGVQLGGAALIENSFSYPGMGYFLGQATGQRDYTLMQGILIITSFAVIMANLLADVLYAKLDPRVKLEE
jgi:peptide/nickel transport system permease protein